MNLTQVYRCPVCGCDWSCEVTDPAELEYGAERECPDCDGAGKSRGGRLPDEDLP